MVLKKEAEPYTRCPLAAMKRQKPKLQLQLRGEKSAGAGASDVPSLLVTTSDDNATPRMHPKGTDEASEFQKPLPTEIHCGESRSRFFIPLFFVARSLFSSLCRLPSPPPGRHVIPRPTVLHCATYVVLFFKVEMHLHICMCAARTYRTLDRVTKWTRGSGVGR